MKITFLRNYRKSGTGNPVFVYTVSGTEKEIGEYSQAQGEQLRLDEETQKPLWFSTRYVQDNGKLIITRNGKIVADTSEFDKAASLAQQYGGNLGQALAMSAAANLLGGSFRPVDQAPMVASPEGLDKM